MLLWKSIWVYWNLFLLFFILLFFICFVNISLGTDTNSKTSYSYWTSQSWYHWSCWNWYGNRFKIIESSYIFLTSISHFIHLLFLSKNATYTIFLKTKFAWNIAWISCTLLLNNLWIFLSFSLGSGKTAAFVIPLLVWITGLPESDR